VSPDNGDFVLSWDSGNDWVAEWLQEWSATEEIASGLNATFRLPRDLFLAHGQCGQVNAFFDPNQDAVLMCYELVGDVYDEFETALGDTEVDTWPQLVIDTYWFVLFHEIGHGLVHYYDLPVTGSQEDAVDEFAAVVLVLNGRAQAVVSAALYWQLSDGGDAPTRGQLADSHGLNMQRMYNQLCWVYGSDPSNWGTLLEYYPELGNRNCESEYQQKRDAWLTLLAPWMH